MDKKVFVNIEKLSILGVIYCNYKKDFEVENILNMTKNKKIMNKLISDSFVQFWGKRIAVLKKK